MKIKLIFVITALLCSACFAHTSAFNIRWWDQSTYSNLPGNTLKQWAEGMEGRVGFNAGTGKIWYVDSGVASEGDGTSWANAKDTLNEAIDLAYADSGADRGDVIYIAPGHSETMGAAADEVDLDVAGLTIIGCGTGKLRPLFDFTGDVTGAFAVGADDVTIVNLQFLANVPDVNEAIEVEAGAEQCTIVGCLFYCNTEGTDEFWNTITIGDASDRPAVIGCEFDMAAGAAVSAIYLDHDADYALIRDNVIVGDYSTACIVNDTAACNHIVIANNVLFNGTIGGNAGLNTEPCIELVNTTTGVIVGNKLVCNEATPDAAIVGADMYILDNYYSESEATSMAPMWLTTDTSDNIIGVNDADNAVSTSSVAANADGSIVERLEQINQDLDALTGMAFRGTCAENSTTTTVISSELGGWGDDFFNTGWVLICTYDASGAGTAPEGEVRDITDYATATGTFTVAAFSAALTTNDEVMVRRQEDMNPYDIGILNGSVNVWFVDDGGSNGDGKTWQSAKTTLTAAEALCSAGDIILVGRNHNENLSTGGDTINVAGVSVIGMGTGNSRPLFDCDVDSDEITLDAAGITLKNLRFRPGATALTSCIRVEDEALGATIENCAFVDGEAAGTDEWTDCISVDTSASDLTVINCTYYNSGAPGTFINLDEATIANASIIGCHVWGDFSEAPIWGADAVPTNLLIKDNIITNTQTTDHCIEFQGNATGMCVGNRLYSDSFATMLDPGYMRCFDNWGADGADQQAIRIPISGDTSDVTEDADGSSLERLEFLQNSSEDILSLLTRGTGSVFYVDSGVDSATGGTTRATALGTIEEAVALCTASAGDIIAVMPGHNEAVGASADQLDLDKAGITVLGFGRGELMPTLDYDGDVTGTVAIGAADVMIKGIRFRASITDANDAIDVESAGDGYQIIDCVFSCEEIGTDEFKGCIVIADTANDGLIQNCKFRMGAGAAVNAIHIDADIVGLTIEDCIIWGDYSTACIKGDEASDDIIIRRNILFNGTMGGDGELHSEPAIELADSTGGFILDNRIASDVATGLAMRVADDCVFMNNYITDTDGDEFSGVTEDTAASITAHADGD